MTFVLTILYAKYISFINSRIWSMYNIQAALLFNVIELLRKMWRTHSFSHCLEKNNLRVLIRVG